MSVLICSKSYFRGDVMYRVMVAGEIYTINHHLLAALQSGDTVEELGLEPDEGEDEDDEREPSAGWRHRSNVRSGMYGR